jgi:predicted nucleotidyltransferase
MTAPPPELSPATLDALRGVLGRSGDARRGGVELVALFGSCVRGGARPDSDVDVAVRGGGFWEQLGVAEEVGRAFGREAHVVDLATASDLLRFEVARHGVPVFEAEPGAWASFQARAMVMYWDLAPLIARTAAGVRARLLAHARAGGRG